MSILRVSLMKLLVIGLCLALAGCNSYDGYDSGRAAAALMILGAGAQNYSAARAAAYQPVQQSTYCYPVGYGFRCN